MKRLSPLSYNLYRFTPDTELREQRKFFKLYCTTLLILGLGALVIWKAEVNHREEIKRSPARTPNEATVVSDADIEVTETLRGIKFTF